MAKKYKSKRQDEIIEQISRGTYKSESQKRMDKRDANLRKQQAEAEDIAPVKTNDDKKWYQKILKGSDAFDDAFAPLKDGYQFGDITKTGFKTAGAVTKTILGTGADVGLGVVKGVAQTGEGIGKLLAGGVAQVSDWVGQDEYADKVRKNLATKDAPVSTFLKKQQDKVQGSSIIGDTGDKVSEAIGYIGSIWASGGAGTATMFTSGTGNALEETYKKAEKEDENVEDWQVWTKSIGTGLIETATEKIGGFFGTSGFDTKIINKIIPKISSGAGKVLTRLGVQASTEAFEEFLSYAGSQGLDYMIDVANEATGGNGMELKEDWNWEEVGEQMAVAFMASGVLGGGASVTGIADVKNQSGLSWNESVNEFARQQDLQENIPTAQDVQAQQTQEIEAQIEEKTAELEASEDVREQQIIQEELEVLQEELVQEAPVENLKQKSFTYEATETDSDYKKAVYESANQVMNDTEASHKLADVVAKISEEKQTKYRFTNNAQLKELGYNIEGKTVNGLVNEDGEVLINIESAKALDKIVGHETTHLLEGTKEYDELKAMAIEFAKTTGDYQSRIDSLNSIYEGRQADIEAELTSDIVGDYLFTNEQFLTELSVQKPTIFQKIKNLISDLVVKFKGTKQEKQLRELQRKFEKAYRADNTQVSETSKNIISKDNQGRKLTSEQESYFKDSKVRDKDGNLLTVYHGTRGDFNVFETKRTGQNYEGGYSSLGRGSYFTSDIDVAKDFGESSVNEGDLNVKETYINIKNPFYADDMARNDSKILKEISEKYDIKEEDLYDGYNLVRLLRSKGVDSTEVLQGYGYDGIIAEDEYVVFDSNQVKNTDNTKPTESKDIRYSLSDNKGRKLSKEQQEFFKDSKIRDNDGNLMEMYHATDSDFTIFDKGKIGTGSGSSFGKGFYFATYEDLTGDYGEKLGKYYLNIKNPFDYYSTDREYIVDMLEKSGYSYDKEFVDSFEFEALEDLDFMEDFLYEALEGKNPYEELNKMVQKAGFDGIIAGSEVIAFEPEQIKNVDNKKPTTNPDIRYSLSEDTEGNKLKPNVEKWAKNSKARDENGNLKVLYHGTATGEFTVFDKSKASPEGDWGAGFYLTDNKRDLKRNYENGGPDFDNKLERLAESIEYNEDIPYNEAMEKAKKELYKGSYKITAYVNIENPAIVGETRLFSYDDYAENYNIEDYESEEDYYGDIDNLIADDIDTVIWAIEREYDIDYEKDDIRAILTESIYDGGIEIGELKDKINELAIETDEGYISNEVARIILESLGYDGIIDNTVSEKFSNMGMEEGTTHYIVFKPNQIKSITNENPTENPDINLSLSNEGEQDTAPKGNFYSEDVKLQTEQIKQQVEEAIAPMQEIVTELVEQMKTIAPVQEVAPVKTEINEKGIQMGVGDQVRTFNNSIYEVTDFFTLDDGVVRAKLRNDKGYETTIGINSIAENLSDPTKNNVSKLVENDSLQNSEAVETQNTEDFDNITDEDAPSFEESIEDVFSDFTDEDFVENTTIPSPLETRDIDEVGSKKVKAYQYEHPEIRPFFQTEAENMLHDLDNTIKGERIAIKDEAGYITEWAGTTRQTAEAIAYLKDNYGYSYEEIRKGLNAIIEDHGAENIAVAKRIEFMLDERLREGYTTSDGIPIPANEEYIKFLEEQEITAYNLENFNAITDEDAPIEEAPVVEEEIAPKITAPTQTNENVPIESKTLKVDKEVAPVQKEAKTQNTELTDSVEKAKQEEYDKIAEVLTERPTPEKKKQRAIMKARASFLDKGSVFEDLSLKTKNRELMAKWDNLMIAQAKAQHTIGSGVQVSNAETKVMEQRSKSLDSIRETVVNSGKLQEFSEYMYHMLNTDRMTLDVRMEEDNKPVFGDGVTAEQSQQIVQDLENSNPEFIEWANDIYEYNRALRDVLVENGVISQETADYFEQKYPHYVPIQRVDVNGNAINVPLDTNRTGINTPIKKATGGNSDIMPLFDTLASRTFQTYRASSKNSFGVELKNTLKSDSRVEQTSLENILDSVEDQESLLQEGKNGQAPTFTVFEDGKKVTYEITQDMFDALKPVSDSSFLSTTIRPLNVWSNFKRGVLTQYNPLFSLTNAMKDFQDILINSQHPAKTYAKFGEAYTQLLGKGYWYQEYMANGGEQNSYFDSQDGFDHKVKGVERITELLPLRAISAVNDVVETAPRLAEYIASRESGRSIEVSMLDASRVTTNFKAGGDVTKWANRNGFTFLNASIQGLNQNIRNVREAHSKGVKGYLNLATKFAIAGVPALLLNGLLWDDDEEYEELSDYVKQNYYVVGKMEDGTFIRIPKGRMSAVLQEGANQMANLITGNDEADLGTFLELVANNLAPNNPIENNIFSPFAQVATNTTWYGEDLVPSRLQDEPVKEQYDESTDKFSIWLGQQLGVSPIKINYLLDQNLGGIGDILLPMGTTQAESSTENKVLAPFVNKFTTNSTLNNQNVSEFYETSEELTSKANSVEATDDDILKNKYLQSIKGDMNEFYKEKRELQADETIPDIEKYEMVKEVQEKINALAKEGLDNYENVNKTSTYAQIGDREYYKRKNKDGEMEWKKVENDELEEINDLSMDLNDKTTYFNLKEKISDIKEVEKEDMPSEEKRAKIATLVKDSNLTDEQKAYIYGKNYSSDETLNMVIKSEIPFNEYLDYASQTFESDKDSEGKSISGSRKVKIIDYVNSLNLSVPQKAIIIRKEYSSFREYNNEIIEYVDSLNISFNEKKTVLEELKFTVDEDGSIFWD